MNVLSETKKVVTYKTRILSVDRFKVTESYSDDILVEQSWSVDGGFSTTHPNVYEANHLRFFYYKDISFLNSDFCSNDINFLSEIPSPSLINDWNSLNLDHVICIYTSIDGNIYRINSPNPVDVWHSQDYIGGLCNDKYDLPRLLKKLKKTNGIRNANIENIPHYNCEDGCTKGIYLEYKAHNFGLDFVKGFSKKFFNLKKFEV